MILAGLQLTPAAVQIQLQFEVLFFASPRRMLSVGLETALRVFLKALSSHSASREAAFTSSLDCAQAFAVSGPEGRRCS